MNLFKKVQSFLTDVKVELSKVSWSSRQELMGSTMVVITITFFTAAFVGIIDLLLSRVLSLVFK